MAKTTKKTTGPEIPKGLVRALENRKPSADSEALLTDLIDVWGGTRKLALDLHKEFQNAAEGGMTRQRILEMIQRLVVSNTTHNVGSSITPSDMTEAELDAVAMTYLKRVTSDVPSTTP